MSLMTRYNDILVATDGSEPASRAVDHAITLAEGIGDVVYVLSVADPSERSMAFDETDAESVGNAIDRLVEEMNEHAGEADIRGAVRRGTPAEEILSFADDEGADSVVLGRSSQPGFARDILGSTADRVVQRATLPVVLVPPSAEE
jgi:nucleotide-binding universal stress UspA family protein